MMLFQKLPYFTNKIIENRRRKMEAQTRILLCDENNEERALISESIVKAGYRYVDEVSDGERALERISEGRYDIVIVDL